MLYSSVRTPASHRHVEHTADAPLSRLTLQATIPAVRIVPSHYEIAALAYAYWEQRGRPWGSALDDWLRAERDLFQAHT